MNEARHEDRFYRAWQSPEGLVTFQVRLEQSDLFIAARRNLVNPERETRLACRDMFRKTQLLDRIIPTIEDVLSAGEIERPEPHPEAMPIAIPNEESMGDAGHRA